MALSFVLNLLLSLALGGVIGLEREHSLGGQTIGVRSFALVAALGTLAATVGGGGVEVAALGLVGVFALAALYYRSKARGFHAFGVTTSLLLPFTFLLGWLVGTGLFVEASSTAIVVALLLAEKRKIHALVGKLTRQELVDALVFAILAFVVLPFIPAGPVEVFGFSFVAYDAWLVIVLVSFISFLAHMLTKHLGERGAAFSSFLGGMISSLGYLYFAVTKLRQRAPTVLRVHYVLGTQGVVARNLLLLLALSPALFASALVPLVAILLALAALAGPYLRALRAKEFVRVERPLSLGFAAQFAVLFLAIQVATTLAVDAGVESLALAAFIAGAASSASVVAALALLANTTPLPASTAVVAILASVLGTTALKLALLLRATPRRHWLAYAVPTLAILLSTLAGYAAWAQWLA